MRHLSATMEFDALAAALEERVAKKAVRKTRAPDRESLVLYVYTRNAVFEQLWDPIVELARGLVLDHEQKRVVARPFPKFFNFGERATALPDEPFEAHEKLDGSLGIVFFDDDAAGGAGRWRCATKGSFTAEQASWCEAWLERRDLSVLQKGATYLFEIIYRENRVVVGYDFEGCVLLGGYDEAGHEFLRPQIEALATALSTRAARVSVYDSIDDVRAAAADFDADDEGFVVRFASGFRVKIKGSEYLRIHRLVSRVTPVALWEAQNDGGSFDEMRKDIPEEFWADFDAIRGLLQQRFDAVVAEVEAVKIRWAGKSDKELGLALSSLAPAPRALIFSARKEGERWFEVPRVPRDGAARAASDPQRAAGLHAERAARPRPGRRRLTGQRGNS